MISDSSLITGAKPFLGERVDGVIYRDFSAGKGYASQPVSYQWTDGQYIRDGATSPRMVKFVAEPLDGNDLLIERSQTVTAAASANVFTYWIGRQISEGAYLVFPVEESDMEPSDRSAICAKDDTEGFCTIKTHGQLVTAARATARHPPKQPAVAVLVDKSVRTDKSVRLGDGTP